MSDERGAAEEEKEPDKLAAPSHGVAAKSAVWSPANSKKPRKSRSRRQKTAGKRANDSGRALEESICDALRRSGFLLLDTKEDYQAFSSSPAFARTQKIAVRKMPYQTIYSQQSSFFSPQRLPRCEWWLHIKGETCVTWCRMGS